VKVGERVALVTGGGRGIGRAIALALAREGAHVAVTARTLPEVEAVAAEVRALGRRSLAARCDVAVRVQVEDAVRQVTGALGAVEILVNSAGMAVSAKLLDTDDELWERHLRVNLTGAFYASRAVLPGMLAAGWGRIINVASIAARRGFPYVAAYVASKHGLLGLTRALAAEVVSAGVTVNAICPGYVATDLTWASARAIQEKTGRSYEDAVGALAAFSPQRRLIEPEEVATLAVLLASDDARSVTGQGWNVDGGAVQA
jgi:NAD(P)-dependent dehydrogenase (short-subunit alcohol dehydrogenase family)